MSNKAGYKKIPTDEDTNPSDSPHPATSANFLSLLTFSWMNSIFKTGRKRALNQSDFLPLQKENRTLELTEELQGEWNRHVQDCNKAKMKQPKLWKCILKTIPLNEILFATFFLLIESICRVSQPLVLGLLLHLLSSPDRDHVLAYTCCWLLALSGLSTACIHYTGYRLELLGMRLSSSIKGIIYLKIFLVTQQTLRQTTTGNVIDLISNDVQRIELAPRWIFTSTLTVFEIAAVACLLLYLITWEALMGVLFLVVLIPCVIIISARCAQLRQQTAEVSDRRILLMNELVSGIRALKAHAWEENYGKKIQEVRKNEVFTILKKSALLSAIECLPFTAGTVATFMSIFPLVLGGHVISPSTAFMLVAFINVLRITVSVRLSAVIPLLLELLISLRRIEKFLLLGNMPLDHLEDNQEYSDKGKVASSYPQVFVREMSTTGHENTVQNSISAYQDATSFAFVDEELNCHKLPQKHYTYLSVLGLSCTLHEPDGQNLLQDVTFEAPGQTLTALTGHVGSGKSTLLAAIAGEVTKSRGSITCSGTLAYVSQTAWVFSGTLRENVTFGEAFDEEKYARAIEACALTEDIKRFPNGDFQFVGEHGVVLSGGQRARVNLARAVYADADVYLLDDPLSAVDSKVGECVFNHCICNLLQDKIRVLVTYTERHMKAADQVVILNKGSILGKGTFTELKDGGKIPDGTIKDAALAMDKINADQTENLTAHPGLKTVPKSFNEHLEISQEDKATGKISFTLYWNYFRAGMHPVFMALLAVLFLTTQALLVSPDVWLSHLTKMPHQRTSTTLGVYAALVFGAFTLVVIRCFLYFLVSLRSAENLHNKLIARVLKAPVLFFDTNPAGRILNRCSKDIGCIDEILPKTFLSAIQFLLLVSTAVMLPSFTNAWLSIVSLPVVAIFLYLSWYYLNTSRELKRLEAICRSPIFSHFSETMTGLDTIRTRKRERDFIDQFYRHQDLHNQIFSMVAAGTRWLGVRADVLCSVLITAVALVSVLLSQNPALAGLALAYVIDTAKMSQYAVRQFAEVENLMTSVERIMAYISLDSEPGYDIKALPPINWPQTGHVSFRNVFMRYYLGGPQVLKNLSFEIEGKSKLGIVGRTGDGKSSIVAALLRMPEAEGEIFVDDVCINSIQLQESRRCISVLSQSPVLFSGSLRKNLDPLERHRDDELWDVLEQVQLTNMVESLEGKLEYELLEAGGNLSVGECQLICLARTLLQKRKIVILDEPTANVDPHTERTIWSSVHEKLKNSTVITIAHRLNTVKDCDVILVLREGQIAALGTFDALVAQEGGAISS